MLPHHRLYELEDHSLDDMKGKLRTPQLLRFATSQHAPFITPQLLSSAFSFH